MSDFDGNVRVMTPRVAGWLAFAGALLVVSGVFKILDAMWAFKYDDEVPEDVVSGAQWARWVGIVAATIAAMLFLPWIYYQPLWTILSVALAVLVIYALAAYGGPRAPETPARA